MVAAGKNLIPMDRVLAASAASMKTMTRSGVEEASEEGGISEILEPGAVINPIHHLKTGILFQCPWDIPQTIENLTKERLSPLLKGLYEIGMGCQIMDDIVDLADDIQAGRHNYLASLVHHGANPAEKERLASFRLEPSGKRPTAESCPHALGQAADLSNQLLARGLNLLFSADHQALIKPVIGFLENRIGIPESARRS
jgi:hypothetical protein